MKIIYLSGPISLGSTATVDEILAFTLRFTDEAKRLRALGYEVINPCEFPKEDSWEVYMRHSMRAVAACDVVATLPQWWLSRGSRLEVFVAGELRIPIAPAESIT